MALASIAFPVVIFPLHGLGELRLLDLHFSYTADQAYIHLAELGAQGRSEYIGMALTSDLAFPVVYATTLSFALMLPLRRLTPAEHPLRRICLLPFLIIVIDWCENMSLAYITHAYPERHDHIAHYASLLTSSKWFLTASILIFLISLSGYCLISRNTRRT